MFWETNEDLMIGEYLPLELWIGFNFGLEGISGKIPPSLYIVTRRITLHPQRHRVRELTQEDPDIGSDSGSGSGSVRLGLRKVRVEVICITIEPMYSPCHPMHTLTTAAHAHFDYYSPCTL